MRRNLPTNHRRTEFTTAYSDFRGCDWKNHPELLSEGTFHNIENMDPMGNGLQTRPGSIPWLSGHGVTAFVAPILNADSFDSPSGEFIIAHVETGKVYYLSISGSQSVPAPILNMNDGSELTISGVGATMRQSSGVFYLFSRFGNVAVEISGGVPKWRWLGINSPVSTVTPKAHTTGVPGGSYTYGVSCVRKTGNVVLSSSGVRRTIVYSGGYILTFPGTTPTAMEVVVSWNAYETSGGRSLLADTRENWTHIRLYRSKNLDSSVGAQNELYMLKELTRADFIGATYNWKFPLDTVPDDQLDDSTLVLADEIDRSLIPSAAIASVTRRRIWVSGCLAIDPTESRAYHGGLPDTQYAETYIPLQSQVPVSAGDGQKVVEMLTIDDDLVLFKTSSTYRIPSGDPDQGAVLVDPNLGVSKAGAAFSVSALGICAICNDGKFRLLDRSFGWRTNIGGVDISTPVSEIFNKNTTVRGVWHRDKLYVYTKSPISSDIYVLLLDSVIGWTKYKYPKVGMYSVDFIIQVDDKQKLLLIPKYLPPFEIDAESGGTDDSIAGQIPISSKIYPRPVHTTNGFVELWNLKLFAALGNYAEVVDIYSSGSGWINGQASLEMKFLPNPIPASWVDQMQGYEWYPPVLANGVSRPMGRSIGIELKFQGIAVVRSIEIQGYTETGPLPVGWDPVAARNG